MSASNSESKKETVGVPVDLDNAHPFVKRALKEMTHRTHLHDGIATWFSEDRVLHVEVSREHVRRALRIVDAVIKGLIERGGTFRKGREQWHWEVSVGQEPVRFRICEHRSRHALDLTEEEKEARGIWRENPYEWKGTGRLWFDVCGHHIHEHRWKETRLRPLEKKVPQIVDCLMQVEEEAEKKRAFWVEYEQRRAEEAHRSNLESRRQEKEEERKRRLVEASARWQQARQLREFIGACERELKKPETLWESEFAVDEWLTWARSCAEEMDPIPLDLVALLEGPSPEKLRAEMLAMLAGMTTDTWERDKERLLKRLDAVWEERRARVGGTSNIQR